MLRRDDAKVQADAIEGVAYDMDFGLLDVTHILAVVWVSKDENCAKSQPPPLEILMYIQPRGYHDLREMLTSGHKVGNIRRDLVGGVMDELTTLRVSRQDELGVRTLRVGLENRHTNTYEISQRHVYNNYQASSF